MIVSTLIDATGTPGTIPARSIFDTVLRTKFPKPNDEALAALDKKARAAVEAVLAAEALAAETAATAYEVEQSIPSLRADDALAGRVGDDRAALDAEARLDELSAKRDAAAAAVDPLKRAAVEAVAADTGAAARSTEQTRQAFADFEKQAKALADAYEHAVACIIAERFVRSVARGEVPPRARVIFYSNLPDSTAGKGANRRSVHTLPSVVEDLQAVAAELCSLREDDDHSDR
jgi:hypothetical protein